ncbi:MAG: Gfo/Idh/MocA family protein [Oceanidesulfovibrio sp.]
MTREANVRWGIVGTSGFAGHTFGPAIVGSRRGELYGCVGSDRSRAEDFADRLGAAKVYQSVDDMAEDPDIEAVWIASPNHMHKDHALALLVEGKHVLCEKPMAVTPDECEAMVEAAEDNGVLLSVGYHMRHHPELRLLRERFIARRFGKPVEARARMFHAYPAPPSSWRATGQTSGGWAINDIGTHLIDLLRWFLGEADQVRGELATKRFHVESDDHAVVMARFDSGGLGLMECSTGAPGPGFLFEIYGTEGFAVAKDVMFGQGGSITLMEPGWPGVEKNDVEQINLYEAQVDHFCAAVRGEEELRVTGEDGLRNVEIISSARGW